MVLSPAGTYPPALIRSPKDGQRLGFKPIEWDMQVLQCSCLSACCRFYSYPELEPMITHSFDALVINKSGLDQRTDKELVGRSSPSRLEVVQKDEHDSPSCFGICLLSTVITLYYMRRYRIYPRTSRNKPRQSRHFFGCVNGCPFSLAQFTIVEFIPLKTKK